MLRWALVVLLAVPLADVLLLVFVASAIGIVETVAIVVLTALVGMLLVRAEGRHTLRGIQDRVAAGEIPTDELLDGGLLIAAGAFLLTPGLVTDALGFLIVIPPTRIAIRLALKRWVVVPMLDDRSGGFVTGNVYTVGFPADDRDGDTVDVDSDAYDIGFEDDGDPGKGNA